MKNENGTELFLLITYSPKQRLLCSWFENQPDVFGQKVYYIGLTNGLGGYNQMIAKGWIDRRFIRHRYTENKIWAWLHKHRKQLTA